VPDARSGDGKNKRPLHHQLQIQQQPFEMLSFTSSESLSSKANNSFNIGATYSQQGGAAVSVGYTRSW
jgi:hypothetical protein